MKRRKLLNKDEVLIIMLQISRILKKEFRLNNYYIMNCKKNNTVLLTYISFFITFFSFHGCNKNQAPTTPQNLAPSVAITNPTDLIIVSFEDSLEITAEASDQDGVINSVKFYSGSSLIFEDVQSPYECIWIPEKIDTGKKFSIVAVALDDKDGRSEDRITVDVSYGNKKPEEINDGLETGSLGQAGIDIDMISKLFKAINDDTYSNLHCLLILRNNKLVFEEYFTGNDIWNGETVFDRDTKHDIFSVTKSFNSALFGIALEQGKINSLDDKLSSYFPEYSDSFTDVTMEISLKDLLTMSSGTHWNEGLPVYDPHNTYGVMISIYDPIKYLLELPMTTDPGMSFIYNTGSSVLLGEIIYKATGLKVTEFAENYLFNYLGIEDYDWESISNNIINTDSSLWITPRSMAKLGLLYLNKGKINGVQVIPEYWVEQSTIQQAPDFTPAQNWLLAHQNTSYGYQWWVETYEIDGQLINGYSARGYGGQFVFIVPSLNLFVVSTAGNEQPPELRDQMMV